MGARLVGAVGTMNSLLLHYQRTGIGRLAAKENAERNNDH